MWERGNTKQHQQGNRHFLHLHLVLGDGYIHNLFPFENGLIHSLLQKVDNVLDLGPHNGLAALPATQMQATAWLLSGHPSVHLPQGLSPSIESAENTKGIHKN
jgi:hypothetical protein